MNKVEKDFLKKLAENAAAVEIYFADLNHLRNINIESVDANVNIDSLDQLPEEFYCRWELMGEQEYNDKMCRGWECDFSSLYDGENPEVLVIVVSNDLLPC